MHWNSTSSNRLGNDTVKRSAWRRQLTSCSSCQCSAASWAALLIPVYTWSEAEPSTYRAHTGGSLKFACLASYATTNGPLAQELAPQGACQMSESSESSRPEAVEAVDPPASKCIEHYRCRDTRDRRGWRPRPRPAEGLEVQWHLQEVDKSLWL
eukprot:361415-Chlamydomonas_euryale.AAC.5